MKSERRHELEHNLLADWLADTLEKIKPYQNAILGGVILLVAAIIAVSVWRSVARQRATAAWEGYFQAIQTGRPDELEDLTGRYPNSRVAHWAATAAGDLRLAAGCDLLFTDQPSAMHELRRAIDLYLTVLENSREKMLLERATFGLARAYEAQIDLERAVQRYEELVRQWPDGPFAEVANERLAALQRRSVRELADKFAKWEPKPEVSDLPDFPASRPEFDLDALPDGPVFSPETDFGLEGLEGATMPDAPMDEPAELIEPTDMPTDPADPAEVPAEPAEPADEPVEPAEPTDEPVEPTDEPAEPAEPADEPAETADESTEPDEPADPPMEASDEPDDSPAEEPAESDADVPQDEPGP